MAQDSQNIESIFDFFYLDNPKIKSFYAQLNGLGALNTLKNTSQIGDTRKMEATVGVPAVTGGKMANDHTVNTTSEQLYDGLPTMPREMINRLDELGFIQRELAPENLGGLVLVKGYLNIVDIEVMKAVIDPALHFALGSMPNTTSAHKNKREEFKSSTKPIVDFMKNIPFALSCNMFVPSESGDLTQVWMSLSREDMPSFVHDINFKHGEKLAGMWYVLGILDAIPNSMDVSDVVLPNIGEMEQFKKAMSEMMKMFGRDDESYGMTPVAIFRVLKAKQ
ncbi:hypothetical protein IF090_12790 [Acinetobacter towneri]|uniref:hypothetical protein n=1 Tax=Acinetobacter towneri TaxID=202956 RepID=UPI001CE1D2EB|nr:hypothetical protein [Acinetobacter towneri]MCA4780482.1 hypothetical protein [Acinetobacter towneri]MCA4785797.1 hypothetical protein [Acinetobacter towneri]MCA4787473.1 hypothetical protein [Acinetobacter towneri]MCA4796943.1 hypothetical protein [Acinetobacter towneri]MCA4802038.1 hypothetical protein [Acinetobacter towneri]